MAILTVLMPVYNAERFVAMAIDSILNQTFTDFEFIIIDDCSADDSVRIINSYTDPRIILYQNEKNMGISATLNRGIEVAKTALIARMDSDDISYPERLQKQYDFITENPDGALYSCWAKVVGQQGQFIRQDIFPSDYYFYNLTFICWIYHPTIIFRKEAVEEVGMYTVPYAEDFELFWQLSRRHKIYNLSEVLLDYRVTDQSLHQVIKKHEYQEAQYSQLLRNLRYYAGDSYTISKTYLDCLQHNFEPLLTMQSVSAIVGCIHELDFLTQQILAKENVNRNINAIQAASFFKRRFIINFFANHLKGSKGFSLLIQLKETELLKWLIKNKIKKALFLPTRPSI